MFKFSVEEVDLRGEIFVDAEWMAYIGASRYLSSQNVAGCNRINNSAIWPLAGISSLKELDLSRCVKITDVGIKHVVSITHLEKLYISQTRVTADGIMALSILLNLSTLDLGGLLVSDAALRSLTVLTNLKYLDLWGSNITDNEEVKVPDGKNNNNSSEMNHRRRRTVGNTTNSWKEVSDEEGKGNFNGGADLITSITERRSCEFIISD